MEHPKKMTSLRLLIECARLNQVRKASELDRTTRNYHDDIRLEIKSRVRVKKS